MNSQQKSQLFFFWMHFNEFMCQISILKWTQSSILWIQNIKFSSIFSNEFISWICVNEIRFINSDWIQWICISEFIYLYEFIWFFHIWIHMFHEFIYEFRCTKVPGACRLLCCLKCARQRFLCAVQPATRASLAQWSLPLRSATAQQHNTRAHAALPTRSASASAAATVNVQTQEAIEVLAVCWYQKEKSIFESHTLFFKSLILIQGKRECKTKSDYGYHW